MVDEIDTTWVNGVKVGATIGYNVVRKYTVPAGVLKPGANVIAVRVLDTGGDGGLWGDEKLQVVSRPLPRTATPPAGGLVAVHRIGLILGTDRLAARRA